MEAVIAGADAINHALPTFRELQRALGWLRHRRLLLKDGQRFELTEAGAQVVHRAFSRCGGGTTMEAWDALSSDLAGLIGDDVPPEELTIDEVRLAERAYRGTFARRSRKSRTS